MPEVSAQQKTMNHVLLKNFNSSESSLRIHLPDSLSPRSLPIGWKGANGTDHHKFVIVNPGSNLISMKGDSGWEGNIMFLVTTDSRISAELVEHSILIELLNDLRLKPVFTGSANFDLGYSLMGYQFHRVLLFTFLIMLLVIKLTFRKTFLKSLIVACFLAMVIYSIRDAINHYKIMTNFELNKGQLQPYSGLDRFIEDCKPFLSNSSFTMDLKPTAVRNYIPYHLAEYEYLKNLKRGIRNADYIITDNHQKYRSRVLVTHPNAILVKNPNK